MCSLLCAPLPPPPQPHLLRWVVFHDGRVVYQSPLVRWMGGDSGLWWVGHHDDAPLGPGTWEIEIYFDNVWTATGVVQLF